jgi:hypothetical protein
MKQQTLGNKSQNQWKHVKSVETTTTIKKGAPVVLDVSSAAGIAKIGYGVKSVESLAAAEQPFFFGLAVEDIAPNAESTTIFGYYAFARMIRATRAASTDVWASTAAIALGDVLAINTTAGLQAVSRSGAGSAITNKHLIVAAETKASTTTVASSITAGADTSLLFSTSYLKVFVEIC